VVKQGDRNVGGRKLMEKEVIVRKYGIVWR
jgi:hypothetical protein